MILEEFTVIIPYYRAPNMAARQLEEMAKYPSAVQIIVVDDGSPEPFNLPLREVLGDRARLYRIDPDLAWNTCGARNLGAHVASTDWIMQIDIDHIFPADCARALLATEINPARWYRFPRWRVGAADETRRKDAIPNDQRFGQVKPHGDSYLCRRDLYWEVGGMDEDYAGCLGGGSPFLKQMEEAAPVDLLPESVHLHVHTRDSISDSSVSTLSRDTSEYTRRRREKEARGDTKAHDALRFEWSRVL